MARCDDNTFTKLAVSGTLGIERKRNKMENTRDTHRIFTRAAIPDDVEAMLSCDAYAQAHEDQYRDRDQAVRAAVGKGQCLLAMRASQVAGYALLHHDFFDHGFVSLVVVSPAFQRLGVGQRLLAGAEDACTTAKLFTSTNQSNLAAQGLFASAGFVRSGQIDNLDENDPELVYVKWCR
jgi:ribosomal protein S18 acetylase RimI-like enzyme